MCCAPGGGHHKMAPTQGALCQVGPRHAALRRRARYTGSYVVVSKSERDRESKMREAEHEPAEMETSRNARSPHQQQQFVAKQTRIAYIYAQAIVPPSRHAGWALVEQ